MTKTDAIRLFGTQAALGRALGLSRGRISQWDEELTQRQADLVMGAALRLGLISADQNTGPPVDRDRTTAGAATGVAAGEAICQEGKQADVGHRRETKNNDGECGEDVDAAA